MRLHEEKIKKYLKLTFLFLIMLLGMTLVSAEAVGLFLLFYIAFAKD